MPITKGEEKGVQFPAFDRLRCNCELRLLSAVRVKPSFRGYGVQRNDQVGHGCDHSPRKEDPAADLSQVHHVSDDDKQYS